MRQAVLVCLTLTLVFHCAAVIAGEYIQAYYVAETFSLFKGTPKHKAEKVVELVERKFPNATSVVAFPTNEMLLVGCDDKDHKELQAYLGKLDAAAKLLKEAGFDIVEANLAC